MKTSEWMLVVGALVVMLFGSMYDDSKRFNEMQEMYKQRPYPIPVPLPYTPPTRINTISPDDPDIHVLKKFADKHLINWSVKPDQFTGTQYCATLDDPGTDFNITVSCADTSRDAVLGVIDIWGWQQKNIGVGSSYSNQPEIHEGKASQNYGSAQP